MPPNHTPSRASTRSRGGRRSSAHPSRGIRRSGRAVVQGGAGLRRAADAVRLAGSAHRVLSRSAKVGDHVTGAGYTVAIRVPDHPLALEVLAGFDGAVAAPSANRFGHVSPPTSGTSAPTWAIDSSMAWTPVLDGGPCDVGVESTIVDCTGPNLAILRPGRFGPPTSSASLGRRSSSARLRRNAASVRLAHLALRTESPRRPRVSADAAPGDGLMALASSQTPEESCDSWFPVRRRRLRPPPVLGAPRNRRLGSAAGRRGPRTARPAWRQRSATGSPARPQGPRRGDDRQAGQATAAVRVGWRTSAPSPMLERHLNGNRVGERPTGPIV